MNPLGPTATATITDETLVALRPALRGTLALPGEAGYELATPWNVAVHVGPRAVVAAADAADVAETVRFAAAHGLRVAVQRTGHGAVAMSDDDIVLVHTGRFDTVEIDATARTARLGAGVVWQQVLDAAAPHGLSPIVGSSPNVGVAGFLTGGGIGPLSRTYGLSSDLVRSFDIVTGEGEQLHVTPHEHPELYWGLRGGKGTLGIVTAVEIELVPLAELYGGALYFDGADAPAVLHAWREWVADLPEHANTSIAILQLPPLPQIPPPLAGRMSVAVRYASVASTDEAEALLAPMRAVATPLIDAIGVLPAAAIGAVHADPVDPMPTHEQSALLRELPVEAVEALLEVAGPGANSPQTMVELRLLGGAIGRPAAHPSAFCNRDAAFSLLAIGVLAPPVEWLVPAHASMVIQALEPHSTGRTLPNFARSADADEIGRSYDDDARHWLAALGDQHDPAGVLRIGQVVRSSR